MRGLRFHSIRSVCAAGVIVPLCAGTASAGTIRHDVADSNYLSLANSYPSVGSIFVATTDNGNGTYSGDFGSGTLVAPQWVLTAAHVVDATNPLFSFVSIGSDDYLVTQRIIYPTWTGDYEAGNDIALLKLSAPVAGVTPATLYTGTGEVGHIGTSVGFGATGTGLTGYDGNTAGTKRAGQNVIDATGALFGASSNLLASDFDDPSNADNINSMGTNAPLALEYSIAPGDSGGGTFADFGGGPVLVGVHSFGGIFDAPFGDGELDASYSDFFASTRVSTYAPWVNSLVPEPGAATVLGGLAGLLLARRRRA